MTPLSPLDALGPAFRRTRELLATPFRLGFFLKIALIAALTQPSFYSASLSYPVQGANFALVLGRNGHASGLQASSYGSQFAGSPRIAAMAVAAIVILAAVGIAIWVLMSYLFCRLRFTLFDLVIYRRGRVGRAWSAYGRQSWRYLGLMLLVSLAFLVVAALLLGPMVLNFIRVMKPLGNVGPNINPFPIFAAMAPLLAAGFGLAALWAVTDSLMQDFLLPPMAIEDAPLESALGRFIALLKTDFGPLVMYVLLRFAVGIGLTWLLMLAFFLVLLAAGLVLFGVGTLLYHALWASVAGQVVCVMLAILVGLIVLAIYVLGIIAIYGFAAVWKQAYAAYFFGGRYQELGERLEPPPGAEIESSERPPAIAPAAPAGLPPISDAPAVW